MNICGIIKKPIIKAPRIEYYLESREAEKIDFLIAGGGVYQNINAALMMHNKGKTPVELSPGINPLEYSFTLDNFLKSISVYVEKTSISRQEIIQYVANKLGGAHLDFKRQGKLAEKFKTLDRNIDRFLFKGIPPPLKGKNTVYFELMSIGQLLIQSADIQKFIKKANQIILS